jgi:hypothetical protein
MNRKHGLIPLTVLKVDIKSEQCLELDGSSLGLKKPIISLLSQLSVSNRRILHRVKVGQKIIVRNRKDMGAYYLVSVLELLTVPNTNSMAPCPNDDNDLHTYDARTKVCDFCGSQHHGGG